MVEWNQWERPCCFIRSHSCSETQASGFGRGWTEILRRLRQIAGFRIYLNAT